MSGRRLHISCLALFISSFLMTGQEVVSLGVASEITKGSFPNGIEYYLVSNPSQKGFADFALVRKGGSDRELDRALLDSLPHFPGRPPYKFLADHGAGYTQEGYIRDHSDGRVFSFSNLAVHESEVVDSVMLMLLDIAATSRNPQAVVVSGDVDTKEIEDRLTLLSMMVPQLDRRGPQSSYSWNPRDSLNVIFTYNSTLDVAAISVTYAARRTPLELMNTVQPMLTRAYAEMLGHIVGNRIERIFRSKNIPLAEVRFRYQDSSETPDNEHYQFTLFTSWDYLNEATREFASILSMLDSTGVTRPEYEDARTWIESGTGAAVVEASITNREYVSKCIASYLYGANLASAESVSGYISGRSLPIETELALFNGFVSALLDPSRNLTLRYDVPFKGIDRRVMRNTFASAWANPVESGVTYEGFSADTLLAQRRSKKLRLSSETTEPITGGKMWTFSNGIKVIYKNIDTPSEFRYCLMLREGVASVPDLGYGESAFVEDMLKISNIAGRKAEDFKSMTESNGITMDVEAGLSDFRIYGSAPEKKFPLLMRVLLAIAGDRQPDSTAFDYYRRSEALRIDMGALSPRNVNALMDSIIRPNYYYTDRKLIDNLGEDLPQRAENYFREIFSKVNNGVLVLVGDLDEEEVKKELLRTLSGFETQKIYVSRPKVSSRFASGSVTYTVESLPGLVGGGEIGVNVAISIPMSFNMRNYVAFKAAGACLERELVRQLADLGAYVEVTDRIEVFPSEHMTLYINCRPCRQGGLPASVSPAEPLRVLEAVRKVTHRIDEVEISESDLKAYKESLLNSFESGKSDSRSILEAVRMRYSEGKDVISGFNDAVNSLSVESLKELLLSLMEGTEVEYVII